MKILLANPRGFCAGVDRAIDIVAAHANGLQAAGALWGYGKRAELEAENPRYLFASPADLRTLAFAGRRDCH